MRIHTLLIVLSLCITALFGALIYARQERPILAPSPKTDTLTIRDAVVRIETVSTPEEKQRGLSGRTSLPEGTGMFFVFEKSDYVGIWMPDMLFSIDVLWFDEALRVVHIVEDMSPQSYPTVFSPPSPARYVLEVPAGFVRAHGVMSGDQAQIKVADSQKVL